MQTSLKLFGGTTINQETINEITNVTNYLTEEIQNEITNVTNYYSEVTESTGFVNPDDSEMSFDDGTRYFTIGPVVDSFVFWAFGNRYEKTEDESVQIDDVDGLWYIYYDSDGVLGATQSIWDLSTQVPVATILWDTGAGVVDDNKPNPKPSKFVNAYIISISVPGVLMMLKLYCFTQLPEVKQLN